MKINKQRFVLILPLLVLASLSPVYAYKETFQQLAIYSPQLLTSPVYRVYNGTLSAQQNALDVGNHARWLASASSTKKREALLLTLDNAAGNSDTVSFQQWNGTKWGSFTRVGSDSDISFKGIDIRYFADQNSAIMVYTDNDQATPFSRIWNSTNLGSEIPALNVGSTVRIITLAAHPQQPHAVLLTEDNTNDINFQFWNGSNWTHQIELEDDSWNDYEPIGSAYENPNNRSLILWSDNDQNTPFYRVWNGSNLSDEYTGPNIGGSPRFFALDSKPSANEIIVAMIDDNSDTNLIVWNGSNFTQPTEVATSGTNTRKPIDVSYEYASGRGMVVYSDGTDTLKYRLWNGSSWGQQANVADVGNEPLWVDLEPEKSSNNLSLIVQDDAGDVTLFVWNSTSWISLGEILNNDLVDSSRQVTTAYELLTDHNPNVTLISPSNGNSSTNRNVTFIANLTDDTGLKNATLYINTSSIFLPNQSIEVTGLSNTTSFIINNLEVNTTYLWNVLACDTSDQCSSASSNYTFTITSEEQANQSNQSQPNQQPSQGQSSSTPSPSINNPYSDSGFDKAALARIAAQERAQVQQPAAPIQALERVQTEQPAEATPATKPSAGFEAVTGAATAEVRPTKLRYALLIALLLLLLAYFIVRKLKIKPAETIAEASFKSGWNIKHDEYGKEQNKESKEVRPAKKLTFYDLYEHFPETYKEVRSKGIIALPDKKIEASNDRTLSPKDLKAMFPSSLGKVKEDSLKPYAPPDRMQVHLVLKEKDVQDTAFQSVKPKRETAAKPELQPTRKINKLDKPKKSIIESLKGVYKTG